MKKILVIYYSQSGQLKRVIDSFTSKLANENICVDYKKIVPKKAYPYPWSFYEFFDEFPESVYLDGCEVNELDNLDSEYDLIILGYTIWFLSPSLPITGFLKTQQAKELFKDKPVITLVACRDMWVMAQEKMKQLLKNVDAKLIDNVVLTDQGKSIYTFFTTPRWLLTGKKNAFAFFPAAGISEEEITNASRFGERIKNNIETLNSLKYNSLLKNIGAVNVNGKLIATEKIATKSFKIWGKLIKFAGDKYSFNRKVVITIYAVFLIALILTVVPLNIFIRKLLSPFQKEKIKELENYYELPSGR
ncbi:dialkylrecorsinol condensing enzyme [Sulfurimonas sp.]|uniref:dialkylrecorsinol condensing enzyme n=1 Tax=Sulfurimonas sp. TaxID=2022749 RepID=UPI002AB0979E|nr:dialkylrecorsinol condensing enzyme [Sulfurimonas sp.]